MLLQQGFGQGGEVTLVDHLVPGLDLLMAEQIAQSSEMGFEAGGVLSEIGVIAQEIREVCPQIVSEDENGMLSVDYSKLSILALYCIKDLYGKLKKD